MTDDEGDIDYDYDDFVNEPYPKWIPYPELIPPPKPVWKYPPPPLVTSRPQSSSSDNTQGSKAKASLFTTNQKRDLNEKRWAPAEKKGMGTFLWANKLAIAAGAVVVGGGLWLWDRMMRIRAERVMKEEIAAAQDEEIGEKLEKRCLAPGKELLRDTDKDKGTCGSVCIANGTTAEEQETSGMGDVDYKKEIPYIAIDKDNAPEGGPGVDSDAELESDFGD